MDHEKQGRVAGDGFTRAQAITRQYAKTFYFASRFLPREKQRAAYAIYALCRITDNTVDADGHTSDVQALRTIASSIGRVYAAGNLNDSLLVAFRETVERYGIPRECFDELIEGMGMDLQKQRYGNFEELYRYCYRVAGVVGLIMLHVFGYQQREAERHAVELGIAMQLTNIVRDIKEDYRRGRIYLPRDEMEQYKVTEDHIAGERVDEAFQALLRLQISRARHYYASAEKGIVFIDNLRCRLVVTMMKELYAGILTAAEKNNYDVFSRRAHVSTPGKLVKALQCLLRRDYW
jgi:phytoene synthase